MKEFSKRLIRSIKLSDFLLLLILPGIKYLILINPVLLFILVILFFFCVMGYAFTTKIPRKPGQSSFNLLVLSGIIIICRFYFNANHHLTSLLLNLLLLLYIKLTEQFTPPQWCTTKTASVFCSIVYFMILYLISY